MLTQVEAEVDVNGSVVLLKPLRLKKRSRAIVTILDEEVKPRKSNGKSGKAEGVSDLFGSVSLGHPIGIDNESIDADLAEEYAGRR